MFKQNTDPKRIPLLRVCIEILSISVYAAAYLCKQFFY